MWNLTRSQQTWWRCKWRKKGQVQKRCWEKMLYFYISRYLRRHFLPKTFHLANAQKCLLWTKIREIKDTLFIRYQMTKIPIVGITSNSCCYGIDAHFQRFVQLYATLLSFGEKVLGYHPSNLTEFSWWGGYNLLTYSSNGPVTFVGAF